MEKSTTAVFHSDAEAARSVPSEVDRVQGNSDDIEDMKRVGQAQQLSVRRKMSFSNHHADE